MPRRNRDALHTDPTLNPEPEKIPGDVLEEISRLQAHYKRIRRIEREMYIKRQDTKDWVDEGLPIDGENHGSPRETRFWLMSEIQRRGGTIPRDATPTSQPYRSHFKQTSFELLGD